MKKLFLLFSVLFIITSSCEDNYSVTPLTGKISHIKSGQSFGMCAGKCYQEMIVENNLATLILIERKDRGSEEDTLEFRDDTYWKQIKADLDGFSKKKFLKLQDVYGCPDCADGGAEWLEVRFSNGTTKRVTFNYGSSVAGFEKIISALRTHRLSLVEKYRDEL
ncbi:MAG: hypothetical protein LRY55_15785 [Leadbetterella sp.]|nr:hypothetical protein [Leadbetterella sp.]